MSEACARLGLVWNPERERTLAAYRAEILRWNRRCHLISRSDEARVVEAHFVDSLRPLPFLPATEGPSVMDLGSGAGLPGMVLKIFRPDLRLLLLDSVRKKRVFLLHVTQVLGLDDVRTLAERSEAVEGLPQYRGHFQVVVARASGDLREIMRRASPFLSPGGALIAYKPTDPVSEIARASEICLSLGMLTPEVLPEQNGWALRGCLVMARKGEEAAPWAG
jgi:16S rRNA (guanine527-N7)-methyltransferase